MPAPAPLQSTREALALATQSRVASVLDSSVPAVVLSADGRRLLFLNSAAGHVLGITKAGSCLNRDAPFDETVLKHLQRITPGLSEGRPSVERIRYYRGIKPIILSLTVERLSKGAHGQLVLVTLSEPVRPNVDSSLAATLRLYADDDVLITAFGHNDVLAVAGPHAIIDEAPAEIEAIVERAGNDPVEATGVKTAAGWRSVVILRLPAGSPADRLLYIGPLEPMRAETVPARPADEAAMDEASPGVPVAEIAATATASPASRPFQFAAGPKPQRFIWELDRSGRFTAIGPEFAACLGDAATPQLGQSWDDVATRLALDPDERIAALLQRRQPWHGQIVAWPVEGEALRVPVELTALPTSDADRHFLGFRGFGIIRSGAASMDPLATGLTLRPVTQAQPDGAAPPEDPAEAETVVIAADVPIVEPEPDAEISAAPEPMSVELRAIEELPPEPQPKFPRLVPKPDQHADDDGHFVTLMPAAHISPETLRLTGAERNAFRQIAEALGARFEGDDEPLAAEPPPTVPSSPDPNTVRILSTQELLDQLQAQPPSTQVELASRRPPLGDTRLIDRLPIAVGLTRDEAIIHVNTAFLTLTGYVDLDDLNKAGGLDALFAGPHAAKGWSEDRSRQHIPLVTKSGRVLPVDARIASVQWTGGTALLMTLIAGDRPGLGGPDAVIGPLHERIEDGEARIRELEAILASASDGVLTLTGTGRILTANARAETLFGFKPGMLVGERLVDLMAPESRRAAAEYLEGVARNGIGSLLSGGRELVGVALPDRELTLFATLTRVPSTGDAVFAAIFRDISQWKTSEEELKLAKRRAEEASVQKSDFLAKISHEIRTPLNAIIGFSEVMLGERFGAIGVERYKDYLRDIQLSGTHIMSLVNDLLDLSKVEAGKLDLKFESIQLTDVLAECVQLMQPQANRERIIIRASLTNGLPPVIADHRSIRQIVLNLLSNAIKFTPPGGQVIVSAGIEDSNEVVIRIRDTGYGMSASDIEIAMEPFRQVPNGRGRNTGPGAGSGLGLPLTKALIEANRAALKIDSAVNQGTLVQVTFPAPRVLAAE